MEAVHRLQFGDFGVPFGNLAFVFLRECRTSPTPFTDYHNAVACRIDAVGNIVIVFIANIPR